MTRFLLSFIIAFSFAAPSLAQSAPKEAPSARYVDAAQAIELLETDSAVRVIDVRTKGEYERGHIDGAVQINYFSLGFRKSLTHLKRDTPYLVHCKSGHRSTRAVKIMQEEGFTDIIHLDGGFDAYKALAAPQIAP